MSVVSAQAALAREKLSDAQLSQRLIGTWEAKITDNRAFPFDRAFITFDPDQRFRIIQLGSLLGSPVRAERKGRWRLGHNRLIQELTEAVPPVDGPRIRRVSIVSIDNQALVLKSAENVDEARRSAVPSKLPPFLNDVVTLLSNSFRNKMGISMPKPRYPLASLQRRREGAGAFVLTCDSNGAVISVQIAQSTGSADLDTTAVEALRKWRFKPGAFKKGLISFTFALR